MSALPNIEIDPTPPAPSTTAALRVEDLHLAYVVRGIPRPVLRGVSFEVKPGESYGLVGESGCGKSTTAYAAVRYLPRNARITGGRIMVAGEDITKKSGDELRTFRTHHASMVYQDPGAALNPSTKVGPQVIEAFTVLGQNGEQAVASALAALKRVQIADPERVMGRYPHQLSGGMQQRVVIAMALASDPQLLVLDEPTTGLDATVEASVLDLVRALIAETVIAVLLIAHNLGVIRTMCDRVGVMYAGKIVEEGGASRVFERPSTRTRSACCGRCRATACASRSGRWSTIPGILPQIGRPCRRACSSTAARSRPNSAARSSRRSSTSAIGHWSAATTGSNRGPRRAGARSSPRTRPYELALARERLEDVPPGRP